MIKFTTKGKEIECFDSHNIFSFFSFSILPFKSPLLIKGLKFTKPISSEVKYRQTEKNKKNGCYYQKKHTTFKKYLICNEMTSIHRIL